MLALSTGMRGGELLGLEWRNINLDAGTLDVKQTTTIKGQLGTPKSKNSVRTLQLPSIALEALRRHSRHRVSRFVFPNRKGIDFIRYHSFVIFSWRPHTRSVGLANDTRGVTGLAATNHDICIPLRPNIL